MNYVFAIDETGRFDIRGKGKSFACGVLLSKEEQELASLYKSIYEAWEGKPAPDDIHDILVGNVSVCKGECNWAKQVKEEIDSPKGKPCDAGGVLQANHRCKIRNTVDCIGKCLKDNERFHYVKHRGKESFPNPNYSEKDPEWIYRKKLLSIVDKHNDKYNIFVSTGKPLIHGVNEQDYWYVSILVIIAGLLRDFPFESNANILITLDPRAQKSTGLQQQSMSHEDYHAYVRSLILKYIELHHTKSDVKIDVAFKNDTESYFVNFADIILGMYADLERPRSIDIPVNEYPCEGFMSLEDPNNLIDSQKFKGALDIILANAYNGEHKYDKLIAKIFEDNRSNKNEYAQLWDMFNSFLKECIDRRDQHQRILPNLANVVDSALAEFKDVDCKLRTDKKLEILKQIGSYFAHRGAINAPVSESEYRNMLNGSTDEGRVINKWGYYLSHSLDMAQFIYNAYDFSEDNIAHWKEIKNKHQKIYDTFVDIKPPFELRSQDGHMASIAGTLGQLYAYRVNGGRSSDNDVDFTNAVDAFNESLKYAPKDSDKKRTHTYLTTLYTAKLDFEKARENFERQVFYSRKFKNHFDGNNKICTPYSELAQDLFADGLKVGTEYEKYSYVKLCALGLYLGIEESFPLPEASSFDGNYLWALTLKWIAVAKMLGENYEQNAMASIEKYLIKAINNLILPKEKGENGFTIETLALPVIQLLALVNPDHEHVKKYGGQNGYLETLKSKSPHFAKYVNERAEFLNNTDLANDYKTWNKIRDTQNWRDEVWKRATALPFLYS